MQPIVVQPPRGGLWRVGRGDRPLEIPPPIALADDRVGDRYDSLLGSYRVIYLGSDRETCFAETLSRFRLDRTLPAFDDEWDRLGFMRPGGVPRDWRTRRTLTRVEVVGPGTGFLDVEDLRTRTHLWAHLRTQIVALDPAYATWDLLDVAAIRGRDRRITRSVSQWAFEQVDSGVPRYSGIRYLSRIDSRFECWAVFEGTSLRVLDQRPILRDDVALVRVAGLLGLTVH